MLEENVLNKDRETYLNNLFNTLITILIFSFTISRFTMINNFLSTISKKREFQTFNNQSYSIYYEHIFYKSIVALLFFYVVCDNKLVFTEHSSLTSHCAYMIVQPCEGSVCSGGEGWSSGNPPGNEADDVDVDVVDPDVVDAGVVGAGGLVSDSLVKTSNGHLINS